MTGFTEEEIEDVSSFENLTPEYTRARKIAERAMKDFQAEKLRQAIFDQFKDDISMKCANDWQQKYENLSKQIGF